MHFRIRVLPLPGFLRHAICYLSTRFLCAQRDARRAAARGEAPVLALGQVAKAIDAGSMMQGEKHVEYGSAAAAYHTPMQYAPIEGPLHAERQSEGASVCSGFSFSASRSIISKARWELACKV
jgi:hypothetical protein